jgi:antitoxin HigA-1
MVTDQSRPPHPGQVLLEQFLRPRGISQYRLAKEIYVDSIRISLIVSQSSNVTADTAVRLGRYFGVDPKFWLSLQADYNIEAAINGPKKDIYEKIKELKN